MKNRFFKVILILNCCSILFVCSNTSQTELAENTANIHLSIEELLKQVNSDSLAKTIQDLQSFGTRYENTEGRKKAANYLYTKLKNFGLNVAYDPFRYKTNINWAKTSKKSTNNIWILTGNGYLIHSTDGGKSWNTKQSTIAEFTQNTFILDSLMWWRSFRGGKLFKTSNGGKTWKEISIGTKDRLGEPFFIDSLKGWMYAKSQDFKTSKIYNTNDGGNTWALQYETDKTNFNDVYFLTPDSGWIVGTKGRIASTDNGGQTWNLKQIAEEGVFSMVVFADSKNGFISSRRPLNALYYKTENGGKTWSKKILNGPPASKFINFSFFDSQNGWATSRSSIFRTIDGGKNWDIKRIIKPNSRGSLRSMAAIDSNICVATNFDSAYCTYDGGSTWSVFAPKVLYQESTNVIATKHGSEVPDSVIILGAHYDSRSEDAFNYAPGADDNASGVAAVVELARIMSKQKSKYTLEFIGFGAEEFGLQGSFHYASLVDSLSKKLKAMINFDMIGYIEDPEWGVHITEYDSIFSWFVDSVASITSKYTVLKPLPILGSAGSDDAPFAQKGFPSICFVEKGFFGNNPNLHLTSDEFKTLNIPYEMEVVKAALATLLYLNGY